MPPKLILEAFFIAHKPNRKRLFKMFLEYHSMFNRSDIQTKLIPQYTFMAAIWPQ